MTTGRRFTGVLVQLGTLSVDGRVLDDLSIDCFASGPILLRDWDGRHAGHIDEITFCRDGMIRIAGVTDRPAGRHTIAFDIASGCMSEQRADRLHLSAARLDCVYFTDSPAFVEAFILVEALTESQPAGVPASGGH